MNPKMEATTNNYAEYKKQLDEQKKGIPLSMVLKYEQQADDLENRICTSFFARNQKVTPEDVETAQNKVFVALKKIVALKKGIENDETILPLQKEMLLNNINTTRWKMVLIYYAIPIEAEKGGLAVESEMRTQLVARIDRIQTLLYGPKVDDVPEEKELVAERLTKAYIKGKSNLSEEEKTYFLEKFVHCFGRELSEGDSGNESTGEILKKNIDADQIAICFAKILKIYGRDSIIVKTLPEATSEELLPQQAYMIKKHGENMLLFPKSWNKEQRDKYLKENCKELSQITIGSDKSSVSIDEGNIYIPKNKVLDILNLSGLIDHEINTHMIRWMNQKQFGLTQGENYLDLEEGLAILNQKMIKNSLANIIHAKTATYSHVKTFRGEKFGKKDLEKLLDIWCSLNVGAESDEEEPKNKNSKKQTTSLALRIKRFYPLDGLGGNRKETAYDRGYTQLLESALQFFEKDKEELIRAVKKLYVGKIGFEEYEKIDAIIAQYGIDLEKIVMPLCVGKILFAKATNQLTKLMNDDPRKDLARLTFAQKKIMLQIVNLFEQDNAKK